MRTLVSRRIEEGGRRLERFAFDAIQPLWALQSAGRTISHKSYIPVPAEDTTAFLGKQYVGQEDTRFGVLQGRAGNYVATKSVISTKLIQDVGEERRLVCGLKVMDLAGRDLAHYDGNKLSDLRTVVILVNALLALFPPQKCDIEVYVIGSGDIAKAAVRMLAVIVPDRISKVTICSPNNAYMRWGSLLNSSEKSSSLWQRTISKV